MKKNMWSRLYGKYFSLVYALCIAFLFQANAVSAIPNIQENRLNISLKNVELRQVLEVIKQQSKYDFVYNASEINDKHIVSLKLSNVDISTALNECFKDLDIKYVIKNNIIVLKKNQEKQVKKHLVVMRGTVVDKQGLPIIGATVLIKGTSVGVVTDKNGRFTLRYVTDNKTTPELVFSFIGMKTVIHKMTVNKEVRIVMEDDIKSLDEVVITGMEVIEKTKMTGSATVVTSKDLQMKGITSIDRILEGMVAGLNSTTVSGAPGARAQITIRGENNLSGNTEPLWIIDGLPMMSGVPKNTGGDYAGTIMQDGVGNIMPEDIESISILKDASAAAIYGARAANGVIIITTKKGFRSKTQINYSGSYEYGIAPKNNMDFMNTQEKLQYEKSIVDNFGLNVASSAGRSGFLNKRYQSGYLTKDDYNREMDKLRKVNTDWFDVIFRAAQSHRQNVSLRGGTDELTYYTSISYQQKNGILKSNKYESAGLLMKLDYRPVNNLIVALDVSVNTRKNRDHASVVDPFHYAVFANPYERPFDENGDYAPDLSYLPNNYSGETASGYLYDKFNILKEMDNTKSHQSGLDASLTLNLRYEVIPGLSLESIVRKGVSHNSSSVEVDEKTYTSWANESLARSVYRGNKLFPSRYDNGELSESSGKNNNWSIRNQLDYSFDIKDAHYFSILLANEVMSKKYNNSGYKSPIYNAEYRITGLPDFDKDVLYQDVKGNLRSLFHTNEGQERTVSFLGRLRYSYKDRYVLNFSYRSDGADVIGNTNRFVPLWSIGARYNLHKEKFFPNSVISELSLRGSFGYTGNIDRSALPFSTISIGDKFYNGNRVASNFTYANPTVKWEKKKDRNIGLDISLFDGRVGFTADYYSNRTTDVLTAVDVPYSTGRSSGVRLNGGIVENKGVELYLNVKWVKKGDFSFTTTFNIARNKNVIKKSKHSFDSFSEMVESNTGVVLGGVTNINGYETGAIYGWKTAGVNPVSGYPRYYLTDAGKRDYAVFIEKWETYNSMTQSNYGNIMTSMTSVPEYADFVRDASAIPNFFKSSIQYLGRSNPKYVGGFNTSFRYKSFDFSTSWTFKVGHIIPNFNDYRNAPNNLSNTSRASYGYSSDLAVSGTNREKRFLSYWQAPGDVTDVAKFAPDPRGERWAPVCKSSDYSKGDYLRMTNLSLSYRFPSRLLKKMNMKSLMVGFSARNLLTFTKYRGLDVGSQGSFTYPVAKEFNFKLSVGF